MATFPRSRTHEEVVCGVPTTFVLTAYSNRVMVIVTQQPNMGTLVRSQQKDHHSEGWHQSEANAASAAACA